jgi:cell wall-associated NlpC family hydrolase
MSKIELMLDYAKRLLFTPYIWGGDSPLVGLDCSGFVQHCLAAVGLDPAGDQTAQALYYHFHYKGATKPQAGALIFFGASPRQITHVAICLDGEHMIEAGGGGSKTLSKEDAIAQGAYVRIRPIINRKDMVGCFKLQ